MMSTGTQTNPSWAASTDSPANVASLTGGVKPRPPHSYRRRRKPIPPHRLTPGERLVLLHYWIWFHVVRFIRWNTLCVREVNREVLDRPGAFVLACTHISHLEPVLLGPSVRRKVDWMARVEFYQYPVVAWLLNSVGCFPVKRGGAPVSAIRAAVARLNAGRVVGIFPEGGVAKGPDFVCRGGAIKGGACVISRRAGVPVIPVVFLGTHVLNAAIPWMPFRTFPPKRTSLYIAYGRPIEPVMDEHCPRRARQRQAAALKVEYARLYAELRDRFGIDDRWIP
jgi:1-acyl-sn-glycerol-3-phosphate acyltransferase